MVRNPTLPKQYKKWKKPKYIKTMHSGATGNAIPILRRKYYRKKKK